MGGFSGWRPAMRRTCLVTGTSPRSGWADQMSSWPPLRDELGRLVDTDDGRDEAANDYFAAANDPQFRHNKTAQRRFKSQLRRRLRHRAAKARKRICA